MQEQEDDVQRAKSITSSNGRGQELHSSHLLLSCSLIEGDSLYVVYIVPRIQLLIDINIIIGFMNIFIKIKNPNRKIFYARRIFRIY